MTATYDPTLLATDTTYQVRLLAGDTDSTKFILTDEEIDFFLSENSNIYFAAARCLESMGAKYAGLVDKQVGDLRIRYSEKSKQYIAQAKEMWSRVGRSSFATFYVGGMLVSEQESDKEDTSLVQPEFTKDMMDYNVQTNLDPSN